jgi:hypothetical protein
VKLALDYPSFTQLAFKYWKEGEAMNPDPGGSMTPQAAAAEIDRTARLVRRRARWQGWLRS